MSYARARKYREYASNHAGAFPIFLIRDPTPFWSKGWRGCEMNCGKPVDDWKRPLVFRCIKQNGTITAGWYCR